MDTRKKNWLVNQALISYITRSKPDEAWIEMYIFFQFPYHCHENIVKLSRTLLDINIALRKIHVDLSFALINLGVVDKMQSLTLLTF